MAITEEHRKEARRLVSERRLYLLQVEMHAKLEEAARSGREADVEAVALKVSEVEIVKAERAALDPVKEEDPTPKPVDALPLDNTAR